VSLASALGCTPPREAEGVPLLWHWTSHALPVPTGHTVRVRSYRPLAMNVAIMPVVSQAGDGSVVEDLYQNGQHCIQTTVGARMPGAAVPPGASEDPALALLPPGARLDDVARALPADSAYSSARLVLGLLAAEQLRARGGGQIISIVLDFHDTPVSLATAQLKVQRDEVGRVRFTAGDLGRVPALTGSAWRGCGLWRASADQRWVRRVGAIAQVSPGTGSVVETPGQPVPCSTAALRHCG
jgi:hypothetical protein